jgi:hypothetical protein
VAIKKQLWSRDPKMTAATHAELKVLLEIRHPNICRLRSVLKGTANEPICLALDLYAIDLHSLLNKYKIRFLKREVLALFIFDFNPIKLFISVLLIKKETLILGQMHYRSND